VRGKPVQASVAGPLAVIFNKEKRQLNENEKLIAVWIGFFS